MINARITLPIPGPRKAANAMASSIPGKDRNALISSRFTKRSNQPPEYPASMPMISPIEPQPHTTEMATSKETRAPKTGRRKNVAARPVGAHPVSVRGCREPNRQILSGWIGRNDPRGEQSCEDQDDCSNESGTSQDALPQKLPQRCQDAQESRTRGSMSVYSKSVSKFTTT